MTGIAFALVIQASMAAVGENSYAMAYRQLQETGRPMLVLVGTEWCPACQQMKQGTLPQARRAGVLSDVSLAMVDADHQSTLARLLMKGSSVPQLILYQKTEQGWKRNQLTGAQSIEQISRLLDSIPENPPATRMAGHVEDAAVGK